MKLLRSPEIKRVLKAYKDAGGEIGRVDIRSDSVSIYPPSANESGLSAYDKWIADNERPALSTAKRGQVETSQHYMPGNCRRNGGAVDARNTERNGQPHDPIPPHTNRRREVMAFCDYHACDNCGQQKTFYDADMDFEPQEDGSYTYGGYHIFALCHLCSQTHEIVIREHPTTTQIAEQGDSHD